MLTTDLRPQKFSDMVGNDCAMNNKLLLALAKRPNSGPHTIMLTGDYGSGKAQPNDTLIPTPEGFKKIGELHVGDFVFDHRGTPTKVLQVFPQGVKDCYEVYFNDGRKVKCCGEHIWTYKTKKGVFSKTLLELIWKGQISLINEVPKGRLFNTKINVPLCNPVMYIKRDLPLKPEALAYILLGGKLDQEYLTLISKDSFISSRYKDLFGETSGMFHYRRNYEVFTQNTLEFLKELHIDKERHIPQEYLTSSIEDRYSMLRAFIELMFDRNFAVKSNKIRIFVPYKGLWNDIALLANSLGICVTKVWTLHSKYISINFNYIFKHNLYPRNLTRLTKKAKVNTDYHTLVAARKIEPCEQTCILVDNKDHLYLTSDYVVTHNTTSARLFARALNCKHLDKDICCNCSNCKESLVNSPFYTELDNSMLGIDDIRDMRDTLFYPIEGLNRVIVFDEVQLLPPKAQATLLKVLEETTQGIHFLLATTNPECVLPTIRSRSLELEFRVKSYEEIIDSLHKLNKLNRWCFSDKALQVVAHKSQGHMRNAHMMLERLILLGEEEFLANVVPLRSILAHIVEACIVRNRESFLTYLSQLMQSPMSEISKAYQDFFVEWMMLVVRPVEGEALLVFIQNLRKRGISPEKVALRFMESWIVKTLSSEPEFKVAIMALFTTWHL